MIKRKHPKNKAERRLIEQQKTLEHFLYDKGKPHDLRGRVNQKIETEEGSRDNEGVYREPISTLHSGTEDQESGHPRPD